MKIRIILFLLSLLSVPAMTFAQKQERMHLRKGNALFEDSAYVDAEIEYRKALDADPKSVKAKYNLGNALANQEKTDDALKEYISAAMAAKTKEEKARIYHNAGVALQKQKKYGECIEAYKNALKANPADDETRYNLALAQKMLKDQQQQQQQQNEQQDKKDQQQQQQDQKQNQNNQNDKKDNEQENQDQQQSQPQQQMSKENAEQLLNAVKQEEQNVRDKVQKQMQNASSRSLEKDW
ncbi:MAG TPA: tetratricopeptide repeat protein [Candidatus Avibacteroides excrementipullorum]|nr:tetratricopeptide repeat protein [Candidatus Avibacteroides excrementipullorum]